LLQRINPFIHVIRCTVLIQLEVKNFKGFTHKVIEFSAQCNLLVGDNGTGKTAVLDALAVGIGTLLLCFDDIVSRTIKSLIS